MRHGVMLSCSFLAIVSCAHTPDKKDPERVWNTHDEEPSSEKPKSEEPSGEGWTALMPGPSSEEGIALTPEPSDLEVISDAKKQKACETIDRISKENPKHCQLERSTNFLEGGDSYHATLCEGTPGKGHPEVLACLENAQDCDQIGRCFDFPIARFKRQCSENIWIEFDIPGKTGSAPATVGLRYSELEEHYDYRFASSNLFLADIESSNEDPIGVCGVSEMMDWLMHVQCPDGSKSIRSTADTHKYKTGMTQGGRCNSRIHNYEIPCGNQTFSHHIEIGICPPGRDRFPSGMLKFKRRYREGS